MIPCECIGALPASETGSLCYQTVNPNIQKPKASFNILVVDDESAMRETIRRVLQYGGHTVEIAPDGEVAVSLLHPGKFHLVITDYHMPGMRGDQLAAHIKQQLPSLPVIMATARPDEAMMDGKANPHVDLLLSKPFQVTELLEAVAKVTAADRPPSQG